MAFAAATSDAELETCHFYSGVVLLQVMLGYRELWVIALSLGVLVACEGQIGASEGEAPPICGKQTALTEAIEGAVQLPQHAEMLLPFPSGHRIRVTAGYGPNAGSALHIGTEVKTKGNEHYALDLTYADQPNGGLGRPVLAPLDGTVVLAGWSTQGWRNFGQRIVLRHQLADGHVYHSQYAHLHSIDAQIVPGAEIAQGQLLGELGGSCQGQLSCNSFSAPHLHFSMHYESKIGGTGTGGSYAGNAVVPEPLDGTEDIERGHVFVSSHQPWHCDREDCLPPLSCESRKDGPFCYGQDVVTCNDETIVSRRACEDGCSNGACQCYSQRMQRDVDSGDCVQRLNAKLCGSHSDCGWERCDQGAWACASADACNEGAIAFADLKHCDQAPPASDSKPSSCEVAELGREIAEGDCVQVKRTAQCGNQACGWLRCEAGKLSCAAETGGCPQIAYGRQQCIGPPPPIADQPQDNQVPNACQ